MLGIPRSTIYRWYHLYVGDGLDALLNRLPHPQSVNKRIPDAHRDVLVDFTLEL